MQLKSGKNCKTCLINHTKSISHHIMPLIINALRGRHTHSYILTSKSNFKKSGAPATEWY